MLHTVTVDRRAEHVQIGWLVAWLVLVREVGLKGLRGVISVSFFPRKSMCARGNDHAWSLLDPYHLNLMLLDGKYR